MWQLCSYCISVKLFLLVRVNNLDEWKFLWDASAVQLLYTIKKKGGKPYRNHNPLPYGLRNSYRNPKTENSKDYAQKPQWNCTFMNSASGQSGGGYGYGVARQVMKCCWKQYCTVAGLFIAHGLQRLRIASGSFFSIYFYCLLYYTFLWLVLCCLLFPALA
jgi:hypothetical protein